MEFLNPYSKTVRDMDKKAHDDGKKKREANLNAKRGISKQLSKEEKAAHKTLKKNSKSWLHKVQQQINDNAQRDIEHEEREHAAEV